MPQIGGQGTPRFQYSTADNLYATVDKLLIPSETQTIK